MVSAKPHRTNMPLSEHRLLWPFSGHADRTPPIWLMRQAGRYLPEYREVRRQAGSFLDLCYAPALAAKVTLQPIQRFGFDAAILFSDILIVPDALGQKVDFVEGEGPRLEPVSDAKGIAALKPSAVHTKFSIICETVQRVRQDLPADTALIGFCGAPWTVATYMVGGRGSPDQAAARSMAYQDPVAFSQLIDLLVETSAAYLIGQIEAGADVLQIFDSWAGSLPDSEFERWVCAPTTALVRLVKDRHPNVPIIGFPRGAGPQTTRYLQVTGVDGISCDTAMPLSYIRQSLLGHTVVQGNLDPLLLVAGGEALERRVGDILAACAGSPFIFNLGHGIVPQTPPANVARLVALVRSHGQT